MQWNIDHISGSPQFLLKPLCYLLSKIKSKKPFLPPLNSMWIRLKLNPVESFISFFIPITFPPTPVLKLVQGLFYGTWCSCTIVSLFDTHSILLGSIIEAESWSLGLPPDWNPHLHHMVVLDRGGLESGPKAVLYIAPHTLGELQVVLVDFGLHLQSTRISQK